MSTTTARRISENIGQLQRYQRFEIEIARVLGGWLPGIVRWETKHAVATHLWEDAEHSRELRTRLWELRVSNPDRDSALPLQSFMTALASAQHDDELLAGVYLVVKAQMLDAYRSYLDATYSVYDGPSLPMLRRIIVEKEAQIAWAREVVATAADDEEKQRRVQRWMRFVTDALAAIGGVNGVDGGTETALPDLPPGYMLLLPFPTALRDSRFTLQPGGLSKPSSDEHRDLVIWQFARYTGEMQAAETLGSVLWETDGMPWDFYYDLARHCADEARHTRLGETRLEQLGYSVFDFPQWVGNYVWRQQVDPLRRYCILTYIIEADSFELKRDTRQMHLANDDIESAEAVQFDILDETMHVRFGHKWVPALIKRYGYAGTEEELVDECRAITTANTLDPTQREAAIKQ